MIFKLSEEDIMNSRRISLFAISLILCFAILAPVSVFSGPTEPNPYDDHPWGGEEPPINPRPSGLYVFDIGGGPLIVINVSDLISLDRDQTLDKTEAIQQDYRIDDTTAKSTSSISTRTKMSTAKRY